MEQVLSVPALSDVDELRGEHVRYAVLGWAADDAEEGASHKCAFGLRLGLWGRDTQRLSDGRCHGSGCVPGGSYLQ